MAQTVTEDIFIAATPDELYRVVADYERYPEFVPGVKGCRVTGRTRDHVDVELTVDLGVKTIRYVHRHLESPPRSVTWSLLQSDWMKVSNGSWALEAEGSGTRARYSVEVQVKKPALVPQVVVDRVSDELTRIRLPKILAAFKARTESPRKR